MGEVGASARLVFSCPFPPPLALPISTGPRACVTKAQIFTVIYEMDGLHPLPSVFPGVRIAWAVCPRHRGRVLPASAAPEFPGPGPELGSGSLFLVSQVILLQPAGRLPPHRTPKSTLYHKPGEEQQGIGFSVLDKPWLPRKRPLREALPGHLSRPGPSALKSQPSSTSLRWDPSFSRLPASHGA